MRHAAEDTPEEVGFCAVPTITRSPTTKTDRSTENMTTPVLRRMDTHRLLTFLLVITREALQ